MLYNAAKLTWVNRRGRLGEVVVPADNFSGTKFVRIGGLPDDIVMYSNDDGVGTKIEGAERLGMHDTVAHDLFAMVCDDAVVRGAEPAMLTSILDVNSLNDPGGNPFLDEVRQLARGYVAAAKSANVAVVNGEVAELGRRVGGYGPFNYNWGASVTWFAKEDRLLTGNELSVGDTLVALREGGLRSNGLSLARKVLFDTHGDEWHKVEYDGSTLGALVLRPSQIYCAAVVDMFGGYDRDPKAGIHGVAHITGGGIPGKVGRMLKQSGLGAHIKNPFAPCNLMIYCQDYGEVPDAEAYKTWNMGQGMVIATPDPTAVMDVAGEHGIESRVIGKITPVGSGITIVNRGYRASEQSELTF
jgi:phosphoribosylformylglycinamidine cyclo-ligase